MAAGIAPAGFKKLMLDSLHLMPAHCTSDPLSASAPQSLHPLPRNRGKSYGNILLSERDPRHAQLLEATQRLLRSLQPLPQHMVFHLELFRSGSEAVQYRHADAHVLPVSVARWL